MPLELKDKVQEGIDDAFPCTIEKAKEHRAEMVQERVSVIRAHRKLFGSVHVILT